MANSDPVEGRRKWTQGERESAPPKLAKNVVPDLAATDHLLYDAIHGRFYSANLPPAQVALSDSDMVATLVLYRHQILTREQLAATPEANPTSYPSPVRRRTGPHAETHTIISPHAIACNAPAMPEVVAKLSSMPGDGARREGEDDGREGVVGLTI